MKNEKNPFLSKLLILIVIINVINNILSQNSTSITIVSNVISLDYDGILGIGWGVFAIILSGIIGIVICILGFSTTYKAIFYTIGATIPILIFLIMVLTPVLINENIKISENQEKNPFVITRYLIMGLVAAALGTLIIPYMKIWSVVLVPQRVDSRSQREYLEKYGKVFATKNDDDSQNNKADGDKGPLGNIISSQVQILSFIYSSNVNQNQQGDIEMANVDNLVNKERKKKLRALKRKMIEEDDLT